MLSHPFIPGLSQSRFFPSFLPLIFLLVIGAPPWTFPRRRIFSTKE
jgi:hypothetical protein